VLLPAAVKLHTCSSLQGSCDGNGVAHDVRRHLAHKQPATSTNELCTTTAVPPFSMTKPHAR
jgi:hypothetical protein